MPEEAPVTSTTFFCGAAIRITVPLNSFHADAVIRPRPHAEIRRAATQSHQPGWKLQRPAPRLQLAGCEPVSASGEYFVDPVLRLGSAWLRARQFAVCHRLLPARHWCTDARARSGRGFRSISAMLLL